MHASPYSHELWEEFLHTAVLRPFILANRTAILSPGLGIACLQKLDSVRIRAFFSSDVVIFTNLSSALQGYYAEITALRVDGYTGVQHETPKADLHQVCVDCSPPAVRVLRKAVETFAKPHYHRNPVGVKSLVSGRYFSSTLSSSSAFTKAGRLGKTCCRCPRRLLVPSPARQLTPCRSYLLSSYRPMEDRSSYFRLGHR